MPASTTYPGQPYLGQPAAGDNNITETEDCLFLDVYLPASTISTSSVPVIVWLYGGGYVDGSKGAGDPNNPLYSGVGFIDAAQTMQRDVIFVVGNYRLGVYGWLAGSKFQEQGGLPNAGLYDQRLLLEWVQKYISQLGGNPANVSLWGESAGAGSIMHHLVAKGWDTPLFGKAMLQSPAFEWSWDQTGVLEMRFENFAGRADCSNLTCLREKPIDSPDILEANQYIFDNLRNETRGFPFGPTVDGQLIEQLPVLRNYHQLQSIFVSHVSDEAETFVYANMSEMEFTGNISAFMPQSTMAMARQEIATQYSTLTPALRYKAVVQDSTFTCNTRQLFDAYNSGKTPVYMVKYAAYESLNLALHGTDLLPTFWNQDVNFTAWMEELLEQAHIEQNSTTMAFISRLNDFFGPTSQFACQYQQHLVAHAVSGDPNAVNSSQCSILDDVHWITAMTSTTSTTTYVSNVVQATDNGILPRQSGTAFQIVPDLITPNIVCDFWKQLADNYIHSPTLDSSDGFRVQDPGVGYKIGQ
ncbi:MAG: hypothetical protein Q9157_005789 [Trypethelium eluteriae]